MKIKNDFRVRLKQTGIGTGEDLRLKSILAKKEEIIKAESFSSETSKINNKKLRIE